MSDSLRDQLLQLGFKPPAKPADKPRRDARPDPRQRAGKRGKDGKDGKQRSRAGAPRAERGGDRAGRGDDIDLAKAYALRQRDEQAERQRIERERQQEAQRRRQVRQALAALLEGKALNRKDSELARHFEFGGKIRRVHVTADQFRAINAGELGVVQQAGRYVLVEAEVARQAAAIDPGALALLVDPAAASDADEYADPRYQVPDDLVW